MKCHVCTNNAHEADQLCASLAPKKVCIYNFNPFITHLFQASLLNLFCLFVKNFE